MCFAAGLGLQVAAAVAEDKVEIKTAKDKTSYAIGVQTARNFKKDGIEVDTDLIMRGMKDGTAGDKLLLSEKDLRDAMSALEGEMRQKMVMNRKELALKNSARGEEYIAANKARSGVVALPNGMQYKVLKAGDGKKPEDGDTVVASFRGTLLDGTQFSGTDEGKTTQFKVSTLRPNGLKDVLKQMPVGSKWQVAIPPVLGYGDRGVGSSIGPNETLLYDVELVAIKAP
jgi:FKBP-type peptidyl-prolyl cis-trans isomerase FklB